MMMTKRDAEWILGLNEKKSYDRYELEAAYFIALSENGEAAKEKQIKKAFKRLKRIAYNTCEMWAFDHSGFAFEAA